jgi:hypothetical protein
LRVALAVLLASVASAGLEALGRLGALAAAGSEASVVGRLAAAAA